MVLQPVCIGPKRFFPMDAASIEESHNGAYSNESIFSKLENIVKSVKSVVL